MTPLRQVDTAAAAWLSQCTCESYIRSVARLARHYRRSPDALSADDVQQYLLHLLRNRKLARTTVNQYGCAYRFLYGTVLGLDGGAFQIPLGAAPQQLPELLSREEIARLFAVACHAQSRTFLMIAYGTGLRVSELCRLRVQDIDSHADRMCIRVVQGKGAKDRYVPLSEGCSRFFADGGNWPVRASGCSWARRAAIGRWPRKTPSAGIAPPVPRPVSPSTAASTRFAMPTPRTCWRPASICTLCSSGSATGT